jgi:mono/diheme cytochrome c family protein/sugar lactone lactonase YvrE
MRKNYSLLMLLALGLSGLVAGAYAQTTASVWDGIYTDAQATRGAAAYGSYCASCHGATLAGTGEAPALAGGQFVGDFNSETVGDIFDRIRTTMPLAAPGSLTRNQYADILAYILKANSFPAGAKELDRRSEYLKAIKFEAAKPRKGASATPAAPPVQAASAAPAAPVRAAGAGGRARIVPADLTALAQADQASGVLSPAASDPRNAPNSQPNPYKADPFFFKMPAGRSMGSTSAVATDSKGHVWIAERCGANDCAGSTLDPIMEFDARGNFIKAFGTGMLLFPHGFFIDAQDHLWITDNHVGDGKGEVVMEFTQDGKLLRTLGKPGVSGSGPDTFHEPDAVLVAPDGSIFVTDGHMPGPSTNARVVKFDKNGTFIKQWGGHGIQPGQFDVPHCLAMDSKGRLYVGDRWNNRIQVFDQDGKLLQILTQFGRPSGIFIDKHDILYVTDSESRTPVGYGYNPDWKRGIRVGSVKDGIVTAFIPDTDPNPDAGATSGAEGIWADDKGVIYGAQVEQKAVVRYTRQ